MADLDPGMTDTSALPAVQGIRQILADDTTGAGWETLWKMNVTPWDRGEMQAPLKELVERNKVPLPTQGKALVPGCGRGYDAVYIATKLGLDTLAVDISATAVEAASLNLKNSAVAPDTKIVFQTKSFFDLRAAEENEQFDLCYDYTFFCALNPSLRPSWGSQMRKLVKKGGFLITLIFPIEGDRPGGPPYSVNVNAYVEALWGDSEPDSWIKVLEEDTTRPIFKGREKIAVWKRN